MLSTYPSGVFQPAVALHEQAGPGRVLQGDRGGPLLPRGGGRVGGPLAVLPQPREAEAERLSRTEGRILTQLDQYF